MNDSILISLFLMILIALFQIWISSVNLQREAKRRWQHALTGHALVEVSKVLPYEICVASLIIMIITVYYVSQYQSDLYHKLVGAILRPNELSSLPTALFFLLGTLLTALLFPLDVGRYAIECLSFADPMAAWVGSSVSSPRVNSSASLAGSTACFAISFVLGLWMLPDFSLTSIIIGSLVATVAEAMSYGYDNLIMPLATAAAVHATRS